MPKKIEKTEQLKFFDVNFRFLKHDLEKDHFSRREVAATMVTENSIESQENGEIPSKKNMFHPDKDDDQRLLRLIEGDSYYSSTENESSDPQNPENQELSDRDESSTRIPELTFIDNVHVSDKDHVDSLAEKHGVKHMPLSEYDIKLIADGVRHFFSNRLNGRSAGDRPRVDTERAAAIPRTPRPPPLGSRASKQQSLSRPGLQWKNVSNDHGLFRDNRRVRGVAVGGASDKGVVATTAASSTVRFTMGPEVQFESALKPRAHTGNTSSPTRRKNQGQLNQAHPPIAFTLFRRFIEGEVSQKKGIKPHLRLSSQSIPQMGRGSTKEGVKGVVKPRLPHFLVRAPRLVGGGNT